jgi:hypothetical protein
MESKKERKKYKMACEPVSDKPTWATRWIWIQEISRAHLDFVKSTSPAILLASLAWYILLNTKDGEVNETFLFYIFLASFFWIFFTSGLLFFKTTFSGYTKYVENLQEKIKLRKLSGLKSSFEFFKTIYHERLFEIGIFLILFVYIGVLLFGVALASVSATQSMKKAITGDSKAAVTSSEASSTRIPEHHYSPAPQRAAPIVHPAKH